IVFSDSTGAGNALYIWKEGTITMLLANPTTVGGVQISTANQLDINALGAIVGNFFGAGSGIYLMADSAITKILRIGETFNGGTVTGVRAPAIDDTGRIAFYVVTDKGESLALWKQGTLTSILADGSTLPDGRVVKTHDTNIVSTNDGFLLVV